MARHENALTTLQARTILSVIRKYEKPIASRDDVEKVAKLAVKICVNKFPVQFPKEYGKLYTAFALSATAKEAVKRGEIAVLDYIAMLAEEKEENHNAETSYNGKADYGAFGDLFEILVRCAFMRSLSFVRWSVLSVKAINQSDIVSKRFGIVEVGHNGKSLTYGTLFDYMDGEYTSIVYGVFSEEDKSEVFSRCKAKDYDGAIDYICSYCAYWSDKYAFQSDMDNLTRGKGITVKGADVQVVYNSGKYNAFVSALESGQFTSLAEVLNG